MSSQKAPPPPDYTPIARAQEASAAMSTELAREQFEWAKSTYAENKLDSDRVVDSFMDTQDRNNETAIADRARYQGLFQPLEDSLASDAATYASPEKRDLEMGRAQADVAQKMDAQRQNSVRELESYGINPGASRFAALDIGARAQQGAVMAAAANQAAQGVDATGRAIRSEAINVGRGYPGQIAGQYGTALQSGAASINGNLQTTQSGANTMGTAPQWQGQANQALTSWGNTLNQGYANQMQHYNANNQSSGIGSALGLAAGIGMKFAGFAEGGSVDEGPGGAVPSGASPSRGMAIDDVPSHLTAGEFVIPKQAVEWHGQKALYALIDKANEQREEAKARTGAVPTVRRAIPQPTTFQSRPTAALPVQRAA